MIDPARSFDRAAVEYEAARPDYPEEILDLAAGTGKLTRVLARHYREVVAVEPLDGMRAIPLDDASVDAVFAAL